MSTNPSLISSIKTFKSYSELFRDYLEVEIKKMLSKMKDSQTKKYIFDTMKAGDFLFNHSITNVAEKGWKRISRYTLLTVIAFHKDGYGLTFRFKRSYVKGRKWTKPAFDIAIKYPDKFCEFVRVARKFEYLSQSYNNNTPSIFPTYPIKILKLLKDFPVLNGKIKKSEIKKVLDPLGFTLQIINNNIEITIHSKSINFFGKVLPKSYEVCSIINSYFLGEKTLDQIISEAKAEHTLTGSDPIIYDLGSRT